VTISSISHKQFVITLLLILVEPILRSFSQNEIMRRVINFCVCLIRRVWAVVVVLKIDSRDKKAEKSAGNFLSRLLHARLLRHKTY
jgi:L-asparagine transporter-like permease